jgi:hypothetical protein
MKHRAKLLLAAGLSFLFPVACDLGTAPGGTEGEGLTGVLVTPSGSPAANLAVRVYPVASGSSGRVSDLLHKVAVAWAGSETDSAYTQYNGRFSFTQLAKSTTYNLSASFKQNDTVFSVFIQNIVYKGGRMDLGRATLLGSGGLKLQVTLDGATATEGVICRIAASPFTDSVNGSGVCVLEGLPPGNFQIEISRPGFRTIVTDALTVVKGLLSEGGLLDMDPLTEPLPPTGQHFELEASTVALWTFNHYAAGTSPYGFEDDGPKKIRLNSSSGRLALAVITGDSAVKMTGSPYLTAPADSIYDPNRTGWLTLEARIYLDKYPSASNTGKRGQIFGILGGVKLLVGSDGSLQAAGLQTSPMEAPSYAYPRTASAVVPLGRWVDVAVAVDAAANQLYAYVNGQPVQLTWPAHSYQRLRTGGAFALNALTVGNTVYSGEAFAGNIDEIRISNTAVLGAGLPLQFEPDTVAAIPDTETDPNLVARYDFEEGSGTTLHDRTANDHDGSIVGGSWVAGVRGKALEFNGSTTRVSIPYKSDLNLSEFTISAWIRSTRTIGQAVISRQTSSGNSATWNYRLATTTAATYGSLVVPAGHLLVDFNPVDHNLNNSPISKVSVVDGVWHQISGVYGDGVLKVYVDGVLDTTAVAGDSPDLTSLQPLLLGASAYSDGAYFKGTMDEVRIYKKALSSLQIDSLYQVDGGTRPVLAANLIAWYDFEEGSGTQVLDKSGKGHDGTLTGTATWAADGVSGNSLHLGGTVGVRIPASPDFTALSDFTVSSWVWQDVQTLDEPVWEFAEANHFPGSSFWVNTNGNQKVFQGMVYSNLNSTTYQPTELVSGSAAAALSRWNNLTLTYKADTRTAILFVNGAPVDTNTTAAGLVPSKAGDLLLGLRIPTSLAARKGAGLKGRLDEVKIFKAAYSATQVDSLYRADRATTN